MTTRNHRRNIPEHIIQQLQQRERDHKHALDVAVARLEDAQATFKIEVMEIVGRRHVE